MFLQFSKEGKMSRIQATTTASLLPASGLGTDGSKNASKVILQAPTTNTASIWVKNEADVVFDGSTGGHELPPGSNIILPISDYARYWIIAASGTQNIQLTNLAGT